MPTNRYQVRLNGVSGLPEDVYENTLYFDTGGIDSFEDTCDGIRDAYAGPLPLAGIAGMEVRVYELAGGQPLFRKEYPTFSKAFAPGVTEVALCLSYTATDDIDAATGRRRGRIFLGPFQAGELTSQRPAASIIEELLDFGEALSQIGFAANTTWKLYSRTDDAAFTIERIYVDNAWDTQRRRGLSPTGRTERDIQ